MNNNVMVFKNGSNAFRVIKKNNIEYLVANDLQKATGYKSDRYFAKRLGGGHYDISYADGTKCLLVPIDKLRNINIGKEFSTDPQKDEKLRAELQYIQQNVIPMLGSVQDMQIQQQKDITVLDTKLDLITSILRGDTDSILKNILNVLPGVTITKEPIKKDYSLDQQMRNYIVNDIPQPLTVDDKNWCAKLRAILNWVANNDGTKRGKLYLDLYNRLITEKSYNVYTELDKYMRTHRHCGKKDISKIQLIARNGVMMHAVTEMVNEMLMNEIKARNVYS